MYSINFSDNIAKLRHDKKITQEQLADFVGVTKASVSKWETGQSMPDVLMLPRLATFFDVTIDELLGYEPQLSREQIIKIYRELCTAFVQEPFWQVMEKSRKLAHQYYSCYPFLYRICLLWMNHFMLAKEEERQRKILLDASELCSHIINNCKDIVLCNDVVHVNASITLLLGDASAVIDVLEEMQNPTRVSNQSSAVLIKAYEMANEMEKADCYTQISMYNQLITLVGCATEYITIHGNDLAVCEETVKRIEKVAEAFALEQLHFNSISLFYFQAAIVFSTHGKKEEALQFLQKFVTCVDAAFAKGELYLHGDAYFTKLEGWFEQLEFGGEAPREKRIILDSAIQAMEHPAFACLQEEEAYKQMRDLFVRRGQQL